MDPRIDVILAHLNLVCKYHSNEGRTGTWCLRAYNNREQTDAPKYVNCGGQLAKCELTESDRIKPDDKDWGEE